MSFSLGIIGLPNVGKSTLFQALTKIKVDASNYPFCTIDPNVGVVEVPDPRLDELAAIVKPQKVVPTTMEFVDIAGLVAGATARRTGSADRRRRVALLAAGPRTGRAGATLDAPRPDFRFGYATGDTSKCIGKK